MSVTQSNYVHGDQKVLQQSSGASVQTAALTWYITSLLLTYAKAALPTAAAPASAAAPRATAAATAAAKTATVPITPTTALATAAVIAVHTAAWPVQRKIKT